MMISTWSSVLLATLIQAITPPPNGWPRLPQPEVFVDVSYPIDALAAGRTGVVVVHVKTDDLGRVQSADALTGSQLLVRAVLENVKAWKLSPGIRDAAIVYRFDIEPGLCQDDSHSLSRLVYPNLVVVSACRVRGRPAPKAAPSSLLFLSRGLRPQYPAIAQSARMTGVVVLELQADGKGGIEPRPLTEIPFLTQAAVAHARQWRVDQGGGKSAIVAYEVLAGQRCV